MYKLNEKNNLISIYFSNILSSDIIEIINKIIYLSKKYEKKWILVYTKYNFTISNDYFILNELHAYHHFARRITLLSHKLYEYKYNNLAKKLINTSTTLHFLFSQLILKLMKLKERTYIN